MNSLSLSKQYLCYNCKHIFNKIYIENSEVECIFCHNQICEEINSPSEYDKNIVPPQEYIPFNSSINLEENNNNNVVVVPFNQENSPLIEFILNLINMEYENNEIENILNYIMNNDPNKYGSPPASKSEIEKLNKYILNEEKLKKFGNENCCSVCKEEFIIGDNLIDLPCKHYFHKDCLLPWLEQHDSCPICRFELKTDDIDYENMKKEKLKRQQNNNDINSDISDNSSNIKDEEGYEGQRANNTLSLITNSNQLNNVVNEVHNINPHFQH